MLLLISSSATQRYSDDIVRALAHPIGSDFQFRYDMKYLAPDVAALADSNKLANAQALVVFMHADASALTTTFVGCRSVTVRRNQIVGSSCILTLAANQYIHPLDDLILRSKLTAQENALLPSWAGNPATVTGFFVFNVSGTIHEDKRAPKEKEMKAFEETAASLSAFPPFNPATGMAFFAVRDVVALDKWWLGRRNKSVDYLSGRFILQSGFRYELNVYTYRPAGGAIAASPAKLAIDSDEQAVRFTSSKGLTLDSRYDLNRFRFTCDEQLFALPAGIRIAIVIPNGLSGVPSQSLRCDISLETTFKGWGLQAALRAVLVAAACALPAMLALNFKGQLNGWTAAILLGSATIAGISSAFPVLRKST